MYFIIILDYFPCLYPHLRLDKSTQITVSRFYFYDTLVRCVQAYGILVQVEWGFATPSPGSVPGPHVLTVPTAYPPYCHKCLTCGCGSSLHASTSVTERTARKGRGSGCWKGQGWRCPSWLTKVRLCELTWKWMMLHNIVSAVGQSVSLCMSLLRMWNLLYINVYLLLL